MTAVSLTKTTMSDVKADALLIGVAQGPNGPVLVPGAADVDKAFKKKLVAALSTLGATGKPNETTKLATLGATSSPQLMAVGLGPVAAKGEFYDHEVLRRATGAAMRALVGTKRVATSLAMANGGRPEDVRAVTEGALLGGYVFARYRTEAPKQVDAVTVVVDNARDKAV
jgi:leucyl aminopeptidase